jgi:hypothetical protein
LWTSGSKIDPRILLFIKDLLPGVIEQHVRNLFNHFDSSWACQNLYRHLFFLSWLKLHLKLPLFREVEGGKAFFIDFKLPGPRSDTFEGKSSSPIRELSDDFSCPRNLNQSTSKPTCFPKLFGDGSIFLDNLFLWGDALGSGLQYCNVGKGFL